MRACAAGQITPSEDGKDLKLVVVAQGAPVPADREAAAKTAETIAREPALSPPLLFACVFRVHVDLTSVYAPLSAACCMQWRMRRLRSLRSRRNARRSPSRSRRGSSADTCARGDGGCVLLTNLRILHVTFTASPHTHLPRAALPAQSERAPFTRSQSSQDLGPGAPFMVTVDAATLIAEGVPASCHV